jgi:hypothetical protein
VTATLEGGNFGKLAGRTERSLGLAPVQASQAAGSAPTVADVAGVEDDGRVVDGGTLEDEVAGSALVAVCDVPPLHAVASRRTAKLRRRGLMGCSGRCRVG